MPRCNPQECWSLIEYLPARVFTAELASRHESAVRERLRDARFPEQKTIDAFDFAAADGIDGAVVLELAGGGRLERGQNVILAGLSGPARCTRRRPRRRGRAAAVSSPWVPDLEIGAYRRGHAISATGRRLQSLDNLVAEERERCGTSCRTDGGRDFASTPERMAYGRPNDRARRASRRCGPREAHGARRRVDKNVHYGL